MITQYNRLNRKAQGQKLNMYKLIDLLVSEGQQVSYTCRAVCSGEVQRRRFQKTLQLEGKIQALWEQYPLELSSYDLLKAASKLNGPPQSMIR